MTKGSSSFSAVSRRADRPASAAQRRLVRHWSNTHNGIDGVERRSRRPRFLGETRAQVRRVNVLDWFHLSMRVQHVTKQLEAGREGRRDLQHGDLLAKKIDWIRWRYGTPASKGFGSDRRTLGGTRDA